MKHPTRFQTLSAGALCLLIFTVLAIRSHAHATTPAAPQRTAISEPTPTPAVEKKGVYYCGAPTRKGTPCQHRVKHQGAHCWQHGGAK